MRNRLDKLADSLLARNAAHEQHIRALRVHAPLGKDAFVERRCVEIRIDTVVNHLHAVFGDAVKFHHVALHALAHGNHAIGSFVGSAFNPATHGIPANAQLLGLPRAVRFQRMRREDKRALQKAACEHSTKMTIPRMTMYYIYVFERCCPLEVDIKRLENLLEMVVFRIQPQLARKAQSADIVFVFVLVAKTASLDMAKFRKLLREELDVNTCTAINFRRKLVSKNSCVHAIKLRLRH